MRRTKLVSILTGFSLMASCFLTTGFSFSYLQEFNMPPVISESLPDPFSVMPKVTGLRRQLLKCTSRV